MAAQDAIATVSREADRQKAPPADRFSKYPASWYLFCSSRQLKDKPISKRILGRELVAFRTASGRLVMMDARCSHLGADLGGGRVVGEGPPEAIAQVPGSHTGRYLAPLLGVSRNGGEKV